MNSSLQKSLNRLSVKTTQVDKNVDNFIKNDTYINIVRMLLIVYSLFINEIPNDIIFVFKNFGVRLFVSATIAYLLFKDVVTALLLALCFILSVQELKKRKHNKMGNNNNMVPNNNMLYNHNAPVMASPNPETNMVPHLSFNNNNAGNPEDYSDPAFKTITQNLVEGDSFTTDEQLNAVGNNAVQGVDPESGVKTFVNQNGAQGLDVPLGFDPESSVASGL